MSNDASRSPFVVLLVEDEPMLRQVVAMTLRREGFSVVEAGDGTAALRILASGDPVDVLLTDVRMPGMSGYQLAESALAARPSLRVALMTGYADEEAPDAIRRAAIPTIQKPFDFATLGASLRKVIGPG